MAVARTALKIRRLRHRFGIRAPRVAVRAELPLYVRAAAVLALFVLSAIVVSWGLEIGRGPHGAADGEARARLVAQEAELAELRGVAAAAESSIRIERAAQAQLAAQVKALEAENAGLKQDLAFFEGLVPGGEADEGVRINRLRIEPDGAPGQYRYRMLLVNHAPRVLKSLPVQLELVAKVQQGGKDVMITHPADRERESRSFRFEIKYFHRAEGVIAVPPGAQLRSVEARVLQDGVVKARQSFNL